MQNIIDKINQLKAKHNAIILAHNYQIPEVQDIADFTGDSLELSKTARNTQAAMIVFCGVHFMAETAAILNPEKIVLLPDEQAGCPMANMINAEQVRKLKAQYPDALVVCYVNTSADVKAESDYCCTSANAVDIVKSIPIDRKIIFIPDKNLARFVAEKLQRKMIIWEGYCPTHVIISKEDIFLAKKEHPQAIVLAHPECTKEVSDISDKILSTGQMIRFVKESNNKEFIIATEIGFLHTLKKNNPNKEFFPATLKSSCPNMKKITLEKILWSLQDLKFIIKIEESIRIRALKALERML